MPGPGPGDPRAVDGWIRHHGYVMGSVCELLVPAGTDPAVLAAALARAEAYEARWTRFQPDSELMALNRAGAGTVHPDTAALLALAADATAATGGLFELGVLDALVAAGYDRSFPLLAAGATGTTTPTTPTTPVGSVGPATSSFTLSGTHVALAPGVRLDLGGIGKGFAADRLVELLRAAGLPAGLVALGGDLACFTTPGAAPFPLEVATPDGAGVLASVALTRGALVTSTVARRRWVHAGRPQHHIVDPRTGAPARSDLVQVSVLGASAAWSEAVAKAALIAGRSAGLDLVTTLGLAALAVDEDGTAWATAAWPAFATLDPAVPVRYEHAPAAGTPAAGTILG